MPVRPSACNNSDPTEQIFMKFEYFSKICREIKVSFKFDKKKGGGYFPWRPTYIYDNISLNSFLEWETFQTRAVQKITTHIVCLVTVSFFPKIVPFMRHCREGQTTDDNMAHAQCILDNYGYKHTFIICITHCFSTTTRLRERASLLSYTYNDCLVYLGFWPSLWPTQDSNSGTVYAFPVDEAGAKWKCPLQWYFG